MSIDLQDDVDSEVTVHVFDSATANNGSPQLNIASVLVRGHQANAGRLSILVAGADDVFPANPLAQLHEGAVTLGANTLPSITLLDPINAADTSLRDHTRVAIAVSGDIRGTIDVGHVFRMQADGVLSGSTLAGGTIDGTITAHTTDASELATVTVIGPSGQPEPNPFRAIEYIRAGKKIAGRIEAIGDWVPSDLLSPSSIQKIVVGRSSDGTGNVPDAEGLFADVISTHQKNGHIGTIYTTGPIGTSQQWVNIHASNGIDDIRAISEADRALEEFRAVTTIGEVIDGKAKDFHIDVRANFGDVYQRSGEPSADGCLGRIQTEGRLTGAVFAGNIAPRSTVPARHGILVRGEIDAPITVDFTIHKADVIGYNILHPIVVGLFAQGNIVAAGRDDYQAVPNPSAPIQPGYLHSLDCGHAVLPPTEHEKYRTAPRGQAGRESELEKARVVCLFDRVIPTLGYYPRWWVHSGVAHGDSVIRADRIGSINLVQMRQAEPFAEKKWPPRIEANLIETLRIDDLREGVVWSGNYEWIEAASTNLCEVDSVEKGDPFLLTSPYNPADDYASILSCEIGCIGAEGHVFYQDCPLMEVKRSLLGSLHVPSLEVRQVIRIGNRLGVREDRCDCIVVDPKYCELSGPSGCSMAVPLPPDGSICPTGFQNPITLWPGHPARTFTLLHSWIDVGDHIGVHDVERVLHGQVIINRTNDDPVFVPPDPVVQDDRPRWRWEGHVDTPSQGVPGGVIRLAPEQSLSHPTSSDAFDQPSPESARGPYYAMRAIEIGGGAVGLVPYAIHYEDSEPWVKRDSAMDDPGLAIVQSWYPADSNIRVKYYGPIKASSSGTGSPVKIVRTRWNGLVTTVTNLFDIQVGVGHGNRDILLRPAPGVPPESFFGGIYEVIPNRTGDSKRLLCDGLDQADTLVKDESFRFVLIFDCDGNGEDDVFQIAGLGAMMFDCNGDGILDFCQLNGLANPPLADENHNGKPDVCELGCTHDWHADFDGDGMVENEDIFNFLNAWFANDPRCDINHSGGVEIQDIFDFLVAWFSGCV